MTARITGEELVEIRERQEVDALRVDLASSRETNDNVAHRIAEVRAELERVAAERDEAMRALATIASMNPAGTMLGNDEDAGLCAQCDRAMTLRENAALDETHICDSCAQDLVTKMERCAFTTARSIRSAHEASLALRNAGYDPDAGCICASIIGRDETRHFRECPLRAKWPDPPKVTP